MKIKKDTVYLTISELLPNDYYLLIAIISSIHKLLSDNELNSLMDNQEKEKLKKDVERILLDLSKEMGSKTAESQAETILRKVIEKATNKTT